MSHSSRYSNKRENKTRGSDQSSEKEFSSASDAIKLVTVNQPRTDSTIVFKMCYRQTIFFHKILRTAEEIKILTMMKIKTGEIVKYSFSYPVLLRLQS